MDLLSTMRQCAFKEQNPRLSFGVHIDQAFMEKTQKTSCSEIWKIAEFPSSTTPTAGSKPCVEGSVLTTQVPLVDTF